MIDVLACPGCRSGIAEAAPDLLSCTGCGRTFPVDDGVVRMLPEQTAPAGGWGVELPPEKYRTGSENRVPQLEDRRFQSGTDSRRKNDRERAIVDWFLG